MASSAPESSEIGFKDRFFDYFKQEAATLQEQIDHLSELSATGSERVDAVNKSLVAITSLQRAVSDASSQLPAQNQKSYSETLKQLNEKLQKARESFAPRQKFSFKNARKAASASSFTPVSQSSQRTPSLPSQGPPAAHEETIEETPDDTGNYNLALRSNPTPTIRSPSFSHAKQINFFSHKNTHIILPLSAAPAITTSSIRVISTCILDLSISWTSAELKSTSFATMNISNINDSLILTGSVKGATHITGMRNSVVVTRTGQLRMHQCENVDVYVWCGSEPVIEHCRGMRFAPLPGCFDQFVPSTPVPPNQWNKIQDFQWIKAEHSPNWCELPEGERTAEEVWRDVVVSGSSTIGLGDILKAVRRGGSGVGEK